MTRLLVVLLTLATGVATAAPVPKALKRAKPLRATIEPLAGEKVYSVDWEEIPAQKMAEWLEKEAGLSFRSKDVPKVNVTLNAKGVCLPELFARLDEQLDPHGWVLTRGSNWFAFLPIPELGNAKVRESFPSVRITGLARRSPYEPVEMVVFVGEQNLEAGKKAAANFDRPGFAWRGYGNESLRVHGRVMDLQRFVDEMGDHIKK